MQNEEEHKTIRVRKIKITGIQIQGVTLRENIKEFANEKGFGGFVRNNKQLETVEVICKKKNEKAFLKEIEDIKKKDSDIIKIDKAIPRNYIIDENGFPNEFIVKREDDLHEMVWALQGAGRVFAVVEKRRIKGFLRGLSYELNTISDWLGNPEYVFEPTSLNNFLTHCPFDDDDVNISAMFEGLQSISVKLREINYYLSINDKDAAITKANLCATNFRKSNEKKLQPAIKKLINKLNS